jgi:hypothetical protein
MISGLPHIELGVLRVPVRRVGIRSCPAVLAKVGLRKCQEYTFIISRPQDIFEGPMCTRFAAIVVRVDEIDAEALKPLECRAGGFVTRRVRVALGVVEWNGGKVQASAVQVEISSFNPEFPEAEANRERCIENPAL